MSPNRSQVNVSAATDLHTSVPVRHEERFCPNQGLSTKVYAIPTHIPMDFIRERVISDILITNVLVAAWAITVLVPLFRLPDLLCHPLLKPGRVLEPKLVRPR